MLVPLYGFVEGDTMGVLVLASDDMPLRQVQKHLSDSTNLRVDPGGDWALEVAGRRLDPERTVAEAKLKALTRIDLRRIGGD